ncbi:MAG: hypothetical protein M1835_006747 [Candelina submexicana]|nr:MAG: hypothetical protein M1835_006747 [Candelina submexicana]
MNDKTSSIDPLPPSYEEISHQGVGSAREELSNPSAGVKASEFDPTLPMQLALVREQRIASLIYTYILPLVVEQGFSGLYRASCVLVPSNVLMPADSSSAADVIIGFPENEDIRLIRLSGEDNKLEFWRQDAVVTELEAKLKEALFSKGHRLASDEDALPTSIPSPVVEPSNSARNSSKVSWFRRRMYSKGVSAQDPTSNSKAGWRAPEEASQLKSGEIRVKVTLEDICLRVVSAMGLYDTRTGKAIIVRVHVADSHYL